VGGYSVCMSERDLTPLYRRRSFTLMWTSTAASGFGDRMITLSAWVLLGGLVAGLDSTAINASTSFWFFLPYIFISMLGGWLADRLPRKWLLWACDQSRGLTLLLVWWLLAGSQGEAYLGEDHQWRIWLALAFVGSFAAIFNPVRNAIIPQIIPRVQLQAGNAIILVINIVFAQIGFLVGKEIITAESLESVRVGLLLGACLYLVSGWFFPFMKPREHALEELNSTSTVKCKTTGSIGEAIRWILGHRRAMGLISIQMIIWPTAALVISAIPGLAKMHYGLKEQAVMEFLGSVAPVLGIGMLVGAGLVMLIKTRKQAPMIYFPALALVGVSIGVLAISSWQWLTFLSAFTTGVFGNMAIVSTLTMLQCISPNWVRGRVMGLTAFVNTTLSVCTYFAIWQLPNADVQGVWAMGVLCFILIGFSSFGLWRYMVRGPFTDIEHPRLGNALWHLSRLLSFVFHRLESKGKHNVPRHGAVLLASNHTTALDPVVIQAPLPRMIRWLMITDYLMKPLWFLWKTINPIALSREEPPSRQVRQVIKALKSDDIVGMFPEGSLQRKDRRLKKLLPGVSTIAKLSGAVVVPVWIEGTPKRDAMLWQFFSRGRVQVTYGKPWKIDRKMPDEEVLAELRERLLTMGIDRAYAKLHRMQCPDCHADLHDQRETGETTCRHCGHVLFDTTIGPTDPSTFGYQEASAD